MIYFCRKCSKILNTFLFLFRSEILIIRAGIHKKFVRIAKGKTLIQKQSDLGLHCLSRPFWVVYKILEHLIPYIKVQHLVILNNYPRLSCQCTLKDNLCKLTKHDDKAK